MSMSLNQEFTPLKLLRFAAPSIIMMMFMSLYTIIDGMFVSRFVGSNALSATNIVYPVVNIMIAIATMLATGGNAIISKYLGEGKKKEAKERLTMFVVITLIVSVVIMLITLIFLDQICYLLGSTDELLPYCRNYLMILAFFAPACMLQSLFQCYLDTGTGSDHFSRSFKCSAGLCNDRALPSGNQRCSAGNRTWSVDTGNCGIDFLFHK